MHTRWELTRRKSVQPASSVDHGSVFVFASASYVLILLARVAILTLTFCLWFPGCKNSNPKPVCGAGLMVTYFQRRPFSLPGCQLPCVSLYVGFLTPSCPSQCRPGRALGPAWSLQPEPVDSRGNSHFLRWQPRRRCGFTALAVSLTALAVLPLFVLGSWGFCSNFWGENSPAYKKTLVIFSWLF